jgi:membrane dipeptidase
MDQAPLPHLAPDHDRVPPWDPGLEPPEWERLRRLQATGTWISLHDHPIRLPDPLTPQTWEAYTQSDREWLGLKGLRRSGLRAVFYSMLDSSHLPSVLRWAALARASLARQEGFRLAQGPEDVDRAQREEQVAVFLSLESANAAGDRLDNLEVMWGAGIRSMGLTYNGENALGCGLLVPHDTGLTPLGRRAVRLLQELGVVVDLAHVGDRTSLDAMELASRPMVISHAGARRLWPSPRMKPDEVLKACAATGGIVGIEAAPHTTLTLSRRLHDIDAVMAHVEYCLELLGPDHVALGPDTFFGDHVALHRLHPTTLPSPDHPWVAYVAGMENPGECFWNAGAWMIRHGYPDDTIQKVLGANVHRVLQAAAIP